jgi:transcriptional regulator with GAF, ATPase, and Fis domain
MAGAKRASGNDVTTCEARIGEEPMSGIALVVRCESGAIAQMLQESQAYVLGRSADCSVVIQDDSVSRQHAKLTFDGAWRIEDLGSRNGTVVDGRRLARAEGARLTLGSVVRLGSATAVLQAGASRLVAADGTRGPGSAPGRDAAIECIVLDAAMQALYETLDVVAPSPLPVLIAGETGVGKELFACAIHARSARAPRPLVQINCAAIPAAMLESELFGYERGAFTGASHAKPGLLETGDGGSVLLDEVGELPFALQAKLLRVLETGQCQRLGALRPRPIDVRIISSTNRDLRQAVAGGEFRADLYHRLNGVPIRIPPLRERRADIVPLAEYFASRMARTMGRGEPNLTDDARTALEAHPWPGNVRELKNVIERAVVLTRSERVSAAELQLESHERTERRDTSPPRARAASGGDDLAVTADEAASLRADDASSLRAELDAMERRRVMEALERCGNNQSRAAKLLGISRHALIARIERFRLQRPRKGPEE